MKDLAVIPELPASGAPSAPSDGLTPPYFVHRDGLPGIDFCRELFAPGENADFPDGVVGIRVDDDFWSVAALPWSYARKSLADVVAEFWPHYAREAQLCPDHGTPEQALYHLQGRLRHAERVRDHLDKELRGARTELKRLRAKRSPLQDRAMERSEAEDSYFIRQYEQLLVAMAHAFEPRPTLAGVCVKCGLLGTDRVHSARWLEKHAAGYSSSMTPLPFFPADGSEATKTGNSGTNK